MKNHPSRAALPALLLFALPVVCQNAATRDRVIYEAAYYNAFSPRTALDMINQTPGFALDTTEESEERRGFAGAVGNVLIDGRRLGAKSQSLQDVLGRVAAREVVRIEVLRGSAVAGDASGASVLANVVRTPVAGGGTWESGFEITNEDKPTPNGKFGWSGRKEATEFSVGGSAFTHDHLNDGQFRVEDGAGAIIERRHEGFPHRNGDYALNGQVSFPVATGKLTLTGQLAYFRHDEEFFRDTRSADDAPIESEDIPFGERTRSGETGLTYERIVGGWDMQVTALATRKRQRWRVSANLFDALGNPVSDSAERVFRKSGETIVRGTFARNVDVGRLEWGAETAVNTLDGEQSFSVDGTPVTLPNANLRVEETRGEGFVSHAWRLSDLWSLDSRLAVETSRLSFSGDTEQSVSLTYLKPRVQLTRQLGRHQLQMRAFRDVGQLDFNDFVSSAQFADDIIQGGNPDLRPQTAWAVEVDADFRFAGEGALRLRAFNHFVDDVVDFVPVGTPGNLFDAPGNIGEGSIVGMEVSLRLPVERLLRGGTLNLKGVWQDTEVTDPLTGEERQFSDLMENSLNAELRQDLKAARFAWGASYQAFSRDADYRLGEVNRFRQIRELNLFAETTWIENFKIRLELRSALDSTEDRDRRIYLPDRSGPLVRREAGSYHPGHWWLLTVSSSF